MENPEAPSAKTLRVAGATGVGAGGVGVLKGVGADGVNARDPSQPANPSASTREKIPPTILM